MRTVPIHRSIRLGYQIGSGDPVDIPIRHMCIAGQTQEAGKTTALEALIHRSGLRALTFVTKPGEAAFAEGRRIPPHFREAADWQFVASILEASRGEKLKFERAWIIRASKGASTLAEVQANVRKSMETARGLAADVYLVLDAYLSAVVPVIASVTWAPSIELREGLNVMDLSDLPGEMQHLVIRSALEWVLHRERGAVVVIPEAWKFLPQGRGTPVKLSAEAYIRQAAARANFLWLDSQDIGGIEKTILRSVPVWVLGVQREANEIKRTLENIPPTASKPKAADLALLEIGQFFACWGPNAIRTYVQPVWMREAGAAAVARGEVNPTPRPHVTPGGLGAYSRAEFERDRMGETGDRLAEQRTTKAAPPAAAEDDMTKEQEKKIDAVLEAVHSLTQAIRSQLPPEGAPRPAAAPAPLPIPSEQQPRPVSLDPQDIDGLYQFIRDRLLDEASSNPAILKVIAAYPEIRIATQRRTIQASGAELTGRLALLLAEGYFSQERGSSEIQGEMGKRGWSHDYRNISKAIRRLAEDGGFFRINGEKFIEAPGVRHRVLEVAE